MPGFGNRVFAAAIKLRIPGKAVLDPGFRVGSEAGDWYLYVRDRRRNLMQREDMEGWR